MSRKMKDSGIKWIGEIPEDWEITKIKRKAQIYTGNSIKDSEKENYLNYENSRPYIPTKAINVNDSTIDYDNGLYIPIDDVNFKIAKKESTLLCIEGGSAGKKIAYLNQDVCFVNKLCCFESINFNSRYLYYYIKSPAFSNEFYLHISGLIGGVSLGEIKEFSITIPSISEQQKIADFLDEKVSEIDKVIEKTKASIEEYKKYKQAIITETVTKGLNSNVEMKDSGIEWIGEIPEDWEITKISQLYRERNEKVNDKDYPPLSVTMKGIIPQLNNVAKSNDHENRKLVCKGDFAINSRSDRRGSCGISPTNGSVSLINTVLEPREKMNPLFYNWLFHTSMFSDEYYKWGHGIVDDLWTTNWNDMKRIMIPLPPISEQQKIANFLDEKCKKIDELIEKKERFIKELETYKKSIIYEYVTGKKEVV